MSEIVIHGDTIDPPGLSCIRTRGNSVTEQTRKLLATIERYPPKPAPTRQSC